VRYRTEKTSEAVQLLQTTANQGSSSMGTEAHARSQSFIEMPKECLSRASPTIQCESDADIARSEENILQWMSYLPDECIRTMILMGWDVTT
jgi:hypothetical protein